MGNTQRAGRWIYHSIRQLTELPHKGGNALRDRCQEVNDPEYGPVYRYLIRDVENVKKLYVSIAAVKGQVVSDFSDVLEAQAEHGK